MPEPQINNHENKAYVLRQAPSVRYLSEKLTYIPTKSLQDAKMAAPLSYLPKEEPKSQRFLLEDDLLTLEILEIVSDDQGNFLFNKLIQREEFNAVNAFVNVRQVLRM